MLFFSVEPVTVHSCSPHRHERKLPHPYTSCRLMFPVRKPFSLFLQRNVQPVILFDSQQYFILRLFHLITAHFHRQGSQFVIIKYLSSCKTGWTAVTPPITPFFAIVISNRPGTSANSAIPLSEVKAPPVALIDGKYFVKASLRTSSAPLTSKRAFFIRALFSNASWLHSSSVKLRWASTDKAGTSKRQRRLPKTYIIFFQTYSLLLIVIRLFYSLRILSSKIPE